MSNGASDEKKKIIIDSQVAARAAQGIEDVLSGKLTSEQITALIECDEAWLAKVNMICGNG